VRLPSLARMVLLPRLPAQAAPRAPRLLLRRRKPEDPRMAALRKWFLTGLLVIVPGAITLAVLHWIVGTLDQTC